MFLVARDCHKSVFDALMLMNIGSVGVGGGGGVGGCDAVLLPCLTEQQFQVSLGLDASTVVAALDQYEGQVRLQ